MGPSTALLVAVRRVLRPLVRFLMEAGVTYPMLADLLRGLFVEVAERDFALEGKPPTDSRITLLTGIHRKEIRRLRAEVAVAAPPPAAATLGAALIGVWQGAREFRDEHGQPLPLPRLSGKGDGPSFERLVITVTKDVRSRAVLDEWLRQGLVTIDADDRVVLNQGAFVPRFGEDEKLYFLGRNLHDHMAAATRNVAAHGAAPFLERAVHYDRLRAKTAVALEALARDRVMAALQEINAAALAQADAETDDPEACHRLNVGAFIFRSDTGLPDLEP